MQATPRLLYARVHIPSGKQESTAKPVDRHIELRGFPLLSTWPSRAGTTLFLLKGGAKANGRLAGRLPYATGALLQSRGVATTSPTNSPDFRFQLSNPQEPSVIVLTWEAIVPIEGSMVHDDSPEPLDVHDGLPLSPLSFTVGFVAGRWTMGMVTGSILCPGPRLG